MIQLAQGGRSNCRKAKIIPKTQPQLVMQTGAVLKNQIMFF